MTKLSAQTCAKAARPEGGRIAYFVHNLNDAAVAKRIRMFQVGAAEVQVAGFWRGAQAPPAVESALATSLGRTSDGHLLQRALMVVGRRFKLAELDPVVADADIIVARNLEMLAIAVGVKRRTRRPIRLVYECLDIHRLMFRSSWAGRVMRSVERRLLAHVDIIIVSSGAFRDRHFRGRQGWSGPVLLVENKVLQLEGDNDPPPRPPGPPWRIGWFGMIRCARSLDILTRLAERFDGKIEVIIRGRVAESEFDDFSGDVSRAPFVQFLGAYNGADLSDIYGDVHFAWALDFFEEGENSTLLLPNRLYEASLYGVPAMALGSVEAGAWLARHGAGVRLEDTEASLLDFIETLTSDVYQTLVSQVRNIPANDLVFDAPDCRKLISQLRGGDHEA
ncbi:glycosyl transferase family 1 [Caulobacter sp. S45]|uniref:glycosyl transferase family 1 n=1 Tax=Caulobacter sp. S45 TaxID=1641861 RepID=UPI001574EE6B|nr:glycosyl transferase family 1 [Caulobacter sp. S45]